MRHGVIANGTDSQVSTLSIFHASQIVVLPRLALPFVRTRGVLGIYFTDSGLPQRKQFCENPYRVVDMDELVRHCLRELSFDGDLGE